MTAPTDVLRLGTDPSGRPIYMSRRMKAMWDVVVGELGFTPTLVQGAFMARVGGGATASAGYHDLSGCIDTRVWDLTSAQQDKVIRVGRSNGWAVWKRDAAHGGMSEHMHWIALGEPNMASGAQLQEKQYMRGLDGLASGGPDYHWRPDRITIFDYNAYLEDDMPSAEEIWNYKFGDTSARTTLVQARENARTARLTAAAVDANQDRLEKAVSALAAKLEQVAPGTAQAVVDALGDRIHIDVHVTTDTEEKPA